MRHQRQVEWSYRRGGRATEEPEAEGQTGSRTQERMHQGTGSRASRMQQRCQRPQGGIGLQNARNQTVRRLLTQAKDADRHARRLLT